MLTDPLQPLSVSAFQMFLNMFEDDVKKHAKHVGCGDLIQISPSVLISLGAKRDEVN